MRLDHIKLMIKLFYKTLAKQVSALDRFLVQQIFLYFGMKRYDDIKQITVGDMKVLDGGDYKVYIRRSNINQEGKGSVFHMSGERINGFKIPDVFVWYMDSLNLKVTDYLFPRLQGAGKGKTAPNGNFYVGYDAFAMLLI